MARIDSDPTTHGRIVITTTDRMNVDEQVLVSRVDKDVVVAADVCRCRSRWSQGASSTLQRRTCCS